MEFGLLQTLNRGFFSQVIFLKKKRKDHIQIPFQKVQSQRQKNLKINERQ